MVVNGGVLKFTSGDIQDLWAANDRATRVYQDGPTGNHFTLTMKGGPTDLRSYEQWNGYGMMLWQDQSNWVVVTNQRSEAGPGTNRVEIAFKRSGAFTGMNTDFGANPCPEYLRIEQDGNTYTCFYSYDNAAWTQVPGGQQTYPAVLKNAQVHLVNKRVFGLGAPEYGTPISPEFDWLRADVITGAGDWQLLE